MLRYLFDFFAIVCALTCINRLRSWRKRSKSLPLPPGPSGLPLIGNTLDMQEPELWEAARKWGKKYGPLVHVEAFGTSLIFVNSYETAVELFEKRGSIYSSRPRNVLFELQGWDWFIPVMPYGDELRRSRQLLHRFLQPAVVERYTDVQTQSVYKMLDRLLRKPDQFSGLLRQALGETIIAIAYGYQAQEQNDRYIAIAEEGLTVIAKAAEPFLVNILPSLQYLPSWFPGTGFKKIAKEGYKVSMALLNEPFEMAKGKMEEGTAKASVVSQLQDAYMAGDAVINDESLIKKVAGVMYGAGADTVVSALHSFFLAMVLYPETQKRAHDELDRVVGVDVLPTFNDRPNLPYINAIVKETLRWQPTAPLAMGHTVDEDDEYRGYLIPKGATILPNSWAMLKDPEVYPKLDEFIPERWLSDEGKQPPLDVHKMAFGFGRRMCPGRYFADNSTFIGAASILASFNITKALNENGSPIVPKAEYEPLLIRHAKPFKYALTPRSDNIREVIRQAVEPSTK